MSLSVPSTSGTATRPDPFRELDELYERVNQLWQAIGAGTPGADRWMPLADIEETDDAYVIELELPGVSDDDVEIQIDGRELTVSGEIKERERKGLLRRRTRRVGEFYYSLTLPDEIDEDNISAHLDRGVLTIRVPKTQQGPSRRVAIGG
ncbi:heat shock protein Hsp20 [Geodermatophilus ruber]|uniref:Heat shock protein Hsp20 n=2 Tax=Geodermatophilus ruber TaxID=504800 RepID=A0A1I4DWB5_9ACTN|nr:heat shock protein Hsp20 [Geodermatophilus ruber]